MSYKPIMLGFMNMKMCSVNIRTALTVVCLALLATLFLQCWSDSQAIAQGKKVPKMVWLRAGTGDCAGHDVGNTNGFTPDNKQAKAGYTAVCWDGKIYVNNSERDRVFCTYKNIAPDKCIGAGNTGVIYKAVAK